MRHTDFRHFKDSQQEDLLGRFSDWAEELVDLMEKRVFGGQFKQIMNFVMSFEDQMVSRLTDDEIEEQLTVCTLYKFTFSEMRDDLELYGLKIKRRYKVWCASRYIAAKLRVIDQMYGIFVAGKITKSNISITKDDVENQFLMDYEQENRLWHNFMDHIQKAYNLTNNIAEDMKDRGFRLMNLKKRNELT